MKLYIYQTLRRLRLLKGQSNHHYIIDLVKLIILAILLILVSNQEFSSLEVITK